MKRILLFLIMVCMLLISLEFKKMDLLQQRREAMENFRMLRSAEVVLEMPLNGNMSWEDMLGKK